MNEIMNEYITPDNKIWGFDSTQTALIPADAVLIPPIYTPDQIPYLTLVNGTIVYNQAAHDAAIQQQQAHAALAESAVSKLIALGLTQQEIVALLGS